MQEMLSLNDVCSFFKVKPQTVRLWQKNRFFPEPMFNTGKRKLWTEDQIVKWIKEHGGKA